MIRIIAAGRYPGLNEYIAASKRRRGNWNGGDAMKKRDQRKICQCIPKGLRFKNQIFPQYTFYEPNSRRDKDNISGYFHKVFQDALVQAGCIQNDGWKDILGMADYFEIDKG